MTGHRTTWSLLDERGYHSAVTLSAEPMLSKRRDALGQVLGNLVTNAAKYTEDGGAIEILRAQRCRGDWSAFATMAWNFTRGLPHVFDLCPGRTTGSRSRPRRPGIGLTPGAVPGDDARRAVARAARGRTAAASLKSDCRSLKRRLHRRATARPTAPPAVPRRRLLVVTTTPRAETLTISLRAAGHEVHTATDGHSADLGGIPSTRDHTARHRPAGYGWLLSGAANP